MCRIEDGATFRCEWLDEVWSSHQRKLEIVHQFLEYEDYWFGTGPPEPGENAAVLGTLRRWTRKHDDLKKAGLYVELSRTGEALAPARFTESERLLEVLNRVHQIGWQLRLGEHIEGQEQDRRAEGIPASTPEDVDEWFPSDGTAGREEIRAFSLQGVPGEVLPNTAYRFNPPGGDRKPFDTFGKPGYEAQTRELIALMNDRQEPSEPNDVQGHSPTPEEP
ncbi:AbiV family abortive infection protein [Phycicoccus duodecadis]|uniref:AbiV family abortive infection protein n=2 Tax=Phycicoccus duodecadis TaxID=173053 RepID=A0A2N3YEY5_9MICO|nr:AbiV family abortive infection protein [Phycicoccus duodecadis]